MNIAIAFLNGVIVVVLVCPIAWFILSRWLFGRPLTIATVAAATAAGLGRHSYLGPANLEALAAAAGAVGSLVAGFLIARIWLTRSGGETSN